MQMFVLFFMVIFVCVCVWIWWDNNAWRGPKMFDTMKATRRPVKKGDTEMFAVSRYFNPPLPGCNCCPLPDKDHACIRTHISGHMIVEYYHRHTVVRIVWNHWPSAHTTEKWPIDNWNWYIKFRENGLLKFHFY